MNMTWLIATVLFSICIGANAILPNYDDVPAFENGLSDHVNFKVFQDRVPDSSDKNRRLVRENDAKNSLEKASDEKKFTDTIKDKLKNGSAFESLEELEDLISHPTWLTDSSKKKMFKTRKLLAAPASQSPLFPKPVGASDSQQEHIKEVIAKFHRYKPKPITDNRITKFVFTNDADLATSRTVQEHNKEVAAAFVDFSRKLEETMSNRPKPKSDCSSLALGSREIFDETGGKYSDILDKSRRKMKSGTIHRQVCSKHSSHSKDFEDFRLQNTMAMPIRSAVGVRRVSELTKTRDSIEHILLDRSKIGPFKRETNDA